MADASLVPFAKHIEFTPFRNLEAKMPALDGLALPELQESCRQKKLRRNAVVKYGPPWYLIR